MEWQKYGTKKIESKLNRLKDKLNRLIKKKECYEMYISSNRKLSKIWDWDFWRVEIRDGIAP